MDSRDGTEKISVKRQLGNKSHEIKKIRTRDGVEQTVKTLNNIEEGEEEEFNREWENAAQSLNLLRNNYGMLSGSSRHNQNSQPRLLTDGRSRTSSKTSKSTSKSSSKSKSKK